MNATWHISIVQRTNLPRVDKDMCLFAGTSDGAGNEQGSIQQYLAVPAKQSSEAEAKPKKNKRKAEAS